MNFSDIFYASPKFMNGSASFMSNPLGDNEYGDGQRNWVFGAENAESDESSSDSSTDEEFEKFIEAAEEWEAEVAPQGPTTIDDEYSEGEVPEPQFPDPEKIMFWVRIVYTEANGEIITKYAGQYEIQTPYSAIRENPEVQAALSDMPQRAQGYWLFDGWSEEFKGTGEILSNVVSEAKFEPDTISLPIDWNGADPSGESTLDCKWGARYPNLALSPQSSGKRIAGVYLMSGTRVIIKTHDSTGNAVSFVNSRELGALTREKTPGQEPHDIGTCNLIIVWEDPVQWNNLNDLRNEVGALPCPFADDPSATSPIPVDDDTAEGNYDDEGDYRQKGVSLKNGFGEVFTKPLINPETGEPNADARVITRRLVNTIGNIGTQEQFFEQCGGYYTFDEDICAAIGGYPESAILRFYDESLRCMRTVYSLEDNNTWNFLTLGVDGIHWKYVDDKPCLSLKVEYSDFIDLASTLFVETGLPDFYEVPYDGYLQLHAFSFVDMHAAWRDEKEYFEMCTHGVIDKVSQTYIPAYDHINGALAYAFGGYTLLDIYNEETNTTASMPLRQDGGDVMGASAWNFGGSANLNWGIFYAQKLPRYVVSQGALFLNKGDKIRVRGVYGDGEKSTAYTKSTIKSPLVFNHTYTDKDVKRHYLCRFANFYRTRWVR